VTSLGRSLVSDKAVIAVVLLDAVALSVMAFTDPHFVGLAVVPEHKEAIAYEAAVWLDFACVVYFFVEMILKIRAEGWRAYWSRGWNRFDFCIVVASAPVLLTPVFDVSDLSLILGLRLGRLFRLFRLMRFIPNREHLWAGAKRAMKASVGIFLGLVIINLIFSLGATQLFARIAPEHFGNPALSSYSLFRVFTVEGWYEIPDVIAERAPHAVLGVLARVYFMGAVLVGGIFGVALANAVFVDEMTMDNNDAVERKIDLLMAEVEALRRDLGGETRSAPPHEPEG
jgi:voltage-gated sodium channel